MERTEQLPRRKEAPNSPTRGRSKESSSQDIQALILGTPILPIPIIAISGHNGVGKTLFGAKCMAQLLSMEHHPWIIGFADSVRHAISSIWGDVGMFNHDLEKSKTIPCIGKTAREALIGIGEGLKPIFGNDIWARALAFRIQRRLEDDPPQFRSKRILIVHDLRFKEEKEWIEQHENYIHLHLSKGGFGSKSEIPGLYEVSDQDVIIRNNGSILDLDDKAQKASEMLLKRRDIKLEL